MHQTSLYRQIQRRTVRGCVVHGDRLSVEPPAVFDPEAVASR